ncbi:MAG: hypothetical protein WB870_02595 [Gallionellaceae bacterium]
MVNSKFLLQLLALLPMLAFGGGDASPDRFNIAPDPDFRSLDEKVQSLKSDVLDLNQDLSHLQDELLTPASTKISVFVSIDPQSSLKLNSVQLQLDNRNVASYLYNNDEQQALQRGGVQRLYLGNVTTGLHQLTASFIGKDGGGQERRGSINTNFQKSLAAKFVELKISKGEANAPQLTFKEWE